MPKIRRYKDWLFEPDWFTDPTDSIPRSQSYLSDSAVIASMSDEAIHDARQRYRLLLSEIDRELLARQQTGRSSIPIAWPGMFGPRRSMPPKSTRRNKSDSRQVKINRLTKSQLEQAVRILTQIMENK